jgi:hypothetical protein
VTQLTLRADLAEGGIGGLAAGDDLAPLRSTAGGTAKQLPTSSRHFPEIDRAAGV